MKTILDFYQVLYFKYIKSAASELFVNIVIVSKQECLRWANMVTHESLINMVKTLRYKFEHWETPDWTLKQWAKAITKQYLNPIHNKSQIFLFVWWNIIKLWVVEQNYMINLVKCLCSVDK